MKPYWFRGRGFIIDAGFARESAARQYSSSIILMVALAAVGGLLLATRLAQNAAPSPSWIRGEAMRIAEARPISASVRYVDKPEYRYQFGTAVAVNTR
jgi:hypothetical protein